MEAIKAKMENDALKKIESTTSHPLDLIKYGQRQAKRCENTVCFSDTMIVLIFDNAILR